MVVTRRSKKSNDKALPPAATPPPRTILTKKKLPTKTKLPPKSPDFVSPQRPSPSIRSRDKEDPSVASPSVHSTGSSGSARRSELPHCLLKQLAHDIEAFGGIESFKGTGSAQVLSKLCNQREDQYGKRGDSLREKITKKVFRWKELDDQNLYVESVLNRFGARSFQNQTRYQEKDPVGSRQKSIEESLAELSILSSSSHEDGSSSSHSADSLPSAVISFKHVRTTKTDRKLDFQFESPVVRTNTKKEETMSKMGIPRDCSKYLFRLLCLILIALTNFYFQSSLM
jgi:hypothetical protein